MWVLLEASYKTGFSTPIQGCLLKGWKIDGKSYFAWGFPQKNLPPDSAWSGKFVVGHPEMWALLGASCKTGISTPTQGCLLKGWKTDGKSCFA